ncbi:MAG TPA: quinolinate synthase NadA [Candidatus Faecaligallichristensenella faecipullorum]|nr:quinolinate synthase NadA [Candidatus Faecaligallichristensenella faecipullorum]
MEIIEEIRALKQRRNALILAHYYVDGQIQAVADYVGDSYFLSKKAAETDCDLIVFCGVRFMAESAKLLNPGKTVLLPDASADCPMAHMAGVREIEEMREIHPDLAVVCYINSTAEIKAHSDVCVTSSNAVKVVSALPNSTIYFIPDGNLARHVAEKVPEKRFLYGHGHCPVHQAVTAGDVRAAKVRHPQAQVLVHPECPKEVVDLSDYAGSTAGIIEYAGKSQAEEFIIGTEIGVMYELERRNPGKRFYPVKDGMICPDMKLNSLQNLLAALKDGKNAVNLSKEQMENALPPLKRMHEIAQ